MAKRVALLLAVVALSAAPAAAQDARSVLQAAADAMGVTNMKSIQYSGTGWIGAVGQNFAPDRDWPRFDITSYTRTIDFETNSSREEMVVVQGNNPPQGGGGTPIIGEQRRNQYVSGNYAWNIQGNTVVPMPAVAEQRLLEIYLTPWGFLKGAMAAENPTMVTRNEYGERVKVISFTALGKYRVNGTINGRNEVQRVQTWIPNPVAGDLYYENVYTNYRTINGVKVPRFHQHQDYDDGGFPNPSGGDHGFGLETVTDLKVNVEGAALPVPDAVRNATVPPVRVQSERLADGVWLLGGGSHNSVLVEFGDHVVVVEAPLNEERSLAVIGEVQRLVPNKPIRFLINTHHHWDHLGGIRTFAHEGATIIAHQGNIPFYQEVLNPARRRSLAPDLHYLNPPEEWSEGYIFEAVNQKYVLSDGTRNLEIHLVPGLAHAAGMLIAYLPREKMVIEADLYTPPAPGATPPPVTASNRTFYNTLQRLRLDVETIVPIHGRPGSMAEFVQFVNRPQ